MGAEENTPPEVVETPQETSYPIIRSNATTQDFFAEHNLDIDKGYTKQELSDLGYGMYNRVGDGQVAIIKEIDGQDTKKDAFITKDQLKKHIEESLPNGIEASELPDIEADMEKFMREVQILTVVADQLDPKGRFGGTWMQNYMNRFLSDMQDDHPDWNLEETIKDKDLYDWENKQEIIDTATAQAKEHYSVPDNVRGIPLSMLDRRGEGRGVFGYPCPCMECDHVFPVNDGIKIYDDGSVTGVPGQVRMNVVTSHLAGHGINNNQNQTVDKDHRYMTLESYLKIYAKGDMDADQPDILALDLRTVEKDVLTRVLQGLREKAELKDKLTDEEIEKTVKKYLLIKD